MPPNEARVALAVQRGLSVICATCVRYWDGRERGLPEPRCTAVAGCASPLGGDDFHEYEGPITDFARWCFRCGATAEFAIQVTERPRRIGICREHLPMMSELRPAEGHLALLDLPPIVFKDGRAFLPDQLLPPPKKKTLFQTIAEEEAKFGGDNGVVKK